MKPERAYSRYRIWQEQFREPILSALLILLACQVFVGIPLTSDVSATTSLWSIAWFSLIVVTGLVATRSHAAVVLMLLSATLALSANVLRVDDPSPLTICVGAGSSAAFMSLMSWVTWCAVSGPGPVTYHRVRGAVVIYLTVALAFAGLYELIMTLFPGAISGLDVQTDSPVMSGDLMYYSLGTLTSIGNGNALPVHPLARSLTTLESAIGQLFPAIFIARIIALEARA